MNIAIILAAGIGKRMHSKINKLLMLLDNKPVVYYSLKRFQECEMINKIILIVREEEIKTFEEMKNKYDLSKIEKLVVGGEKRQDSVNNGLLVLNANLNDIVVIHNGANPLVSEKTIIEVIKAAEKYGAAAAGFKAKDTIKKVDKNGFVVKTLDRNELWQIQTPQAIKYGLAVKAFKKAYEDGFYGTDDVMLIERIGKRVKIVECGYDNFKITVPYDWEKAKFILGSVRVGLGQDSHMFGEDEDKPLVLGGIIIKDIPGLKANSDGDVILHALFNALSQAVGGKSLGYYADHLAEKGVKDSKEYLKIALEMVNKAGYKINNVGIMVEAKRPRFEGYEDKIKDSIANLCGIEKDKIGFTVTSGEELTEFGRGLGIQAFAIVSLAKK